MVARLGGDETRGGDDTALEERVEDLAVEIAALINGSAPEVRKDLRDLAVGLLRERIEEVEVPRALPNGASAAPFNPLGLGIPLLLVGVVLVFLFPPVGLLILLFAAAMLVWGLIAAVRFR